jgi:hypothetical protein
MKRNIVASLSFALVLLCVAGAVYLKWEKSRLHAEPEQRINYSKLPGAHENPLKSFSGETYVETSEKYGVSMEIPIELKENFKYNSLESNQVSSLGKSYELQAGSPDNTYTYVPRYVMSFSITGKDEVKPDAYEYQYESEVFPKLRNLKLGQSFTEVRYTDQEKLVWFGENYEDELFDSDTVYTRLNDINKWKVFEYTNYNEAEASYGYRATLETSTEYIDILLFTFYEPADELREALNDYRDNIFYPILESTHLL